MKKEKNWVNESVFYHIYPLGMLGAPRFNEGDKTADRLILNLIDWIPHLKEMKINAVLFGPIFQSLKHGYDTSNYYETDARLGTKEDFVKVFKELHSNGIKIILDGVFNHVGRGFWAFNDVQHNFKNSEYVNWFCNVNFDQNNMFNDGFSYDTWEGNAELIKLNLKNQDVIAHLLGAVEMWINDFDIDGLRLDAADCIDKDFFKQLRTFTKSRKDDFWLMGEIIHGDYREWANDEMLDSVTNYECWKGIYSSHNDRNYFEIAYSLKREFGREGIYKNLCLYNFLDNHDVDRIASLLHVQQNIRNAYTIMYFMPGVPSIYYGSEWGIQGAKTQGFDADLPVRPQVNIEEWQNKSKELIDHIKWLAEERMSSDAVKYGSYEEILVTNEQLAFARVFNEEKVIVILNLSDYTKVVEFEFMGEYYSEVVEPHSSEVIKNNYSLS